jgi:methylmalonyl-CoA/ethylmalonyl-CoA epimerase
LYKITGLNHVGIAVRDLADASMMFASKFQLPVSQRIESKEQRLSFALVESGNSVIELMEPLDTESTIAKFLEKQGRNALHHIAFAVDSDLGIVADQLNEVGVEMIYPKPRIGVMGHPVNFCHPKFTSNVLIELSDVDYEKRTI